jgi:UPF0755 protein
MVRCRLRASHHEGLKMNAKVRIGIILVALIAGGAVVGGLWAWQKYRMWNQTVGTANNWCIEIPPIENPRAWLEQTQPEIAAVIHWRRWSLYPGRYCAIGLQQANIMARRIATGEREEVSIPVPSKRTVAEIAGVIAPRIWADSASIHEALISDSMLWQITPNTYRVYWEIDAEGLANRMRSESVTWWNADRLKKAWTLGLRQHEVVTLASIVQEETADVQEAPRVAGLYLNRLNKKMLLQADPTLKFALGDWTLRRVLDEDKKVASPYNTYQNPGLPPGPIRITDPRYIDAVLNAEKHNFLYMCAKPDGSGNHAFAHTYQEHLKNARAWQNMLNRERIYR